MAHPWHHSVRSAKLFGGVPEDYLLIHQWFDESKAHFPDLRHRALRHHSEGIFACEQRFGVCLKNAIGRDVPVRTIGEQHVKDDLGWIPTLKDWLSHIAIQPWMMRTAYRPSRDNDMDPAPSAPTGGSEQYGQPTPEARSSDALRASRHYLASCEADVNTSANSTANPRSSADSTRPSASPSA